jgi:hypothetical protein
LNQSLAAAARMAMVEKGRLFQIFHPGGWC